MRWLLLKDLRILRRSPLLAGLLVVYPVLVAVLIGAALSAGPDKPRVAFANLVPRDQDVIEVGGARIDASTYASRLFRSVDAVRVRTRAKAIAAVRSGDALAALVIPADATRRLQGTLGLGGGPPPAVEVFYNAEDPVKRAFVESTIRARLADANAALSDAVLREAASYLGVITRGGGISLPLVGRVDVLGLRRSQAIVQAAVAALPRGSAERIALAEVGRFAGLAADNLDLSRPILASIGEPVRVRRHLLAGARTPLDAYAVAVAVTVSLMLVALLLAAGLLALEREERTFGRLVRGLVGRGTLLAEKVVLAAGCAVAVALLMLAGLAAFVGLDWSRAPLWLLALAAGGGAFAALGVALGALAREVRAASLLAVLLALPLAFLALVPSSAVSAGLADVLAVVSGLAPFKPALQALDAAVNGGGLLLPLLHLAVLGAAFGAAARLSLRRF